MHTSDVFYFSGHTTASINSSQVHRKKAPSRRPCPPHADASTQNHPHMLTHTPAMIFVGATRHAFMPCSCSKEATLMRLPQPRSSTTLAGPLPSAVRCWLMGCASSTRCISLLSSFTTAAVCLACRQFVRAMLYTAMSCIIVLAC